eukprot:gene6931-9562_t
MTSLMRQLTRQSTLMTNAQEDANEEDMSNAIIHYGDQIVLFDNQRGGFVLSQISRF